MEEEAREAGLDDLLAMVGFEASRLGRMLDRLALLLRRRPPRCKKTPLSAFVDAVADRARRTIEDAEVVVEGGEQRATPVQIDSEQLETVLLELIRNGVESYKGAGGCVRLSGWLAAPGLILTVRDEGKGMSAASLKKATEPFHTDKAQASGLGLPIAMVLVHAHGGKIDVQSAVGEGTTITVTIPITESAGE